jgi:hypothetical protein
MHLNIEGFVDEIASTLLFGCSQLANSYFAAAINQFLQDPNVIYNIADFDEIASALLVGFSQVATCWLAAASRSSRRPTSLQISSTILLLRCSLLAVRSTSGNGGSS